MRELLGLIFAAALVCNTAPASPGGGGVGWIPVQAGDQGRPVAIDLHRFIFSLESATIEATPPPDVTTTFDATTGRLEIRPDPKLAGLVEIPLTARFADGNFSTVLTVAFAPMTPHTFRHAPKSPVQSVSVAGSFNGWNTGANPMERGGGGAFKADILLPPGKTLYKLFIDGRWQTDPENPRKEPDGLGGFNSVVESANPATGPAPSIFAARRDGPDLVIQSASPGTALSAWSVLLQLPDGQARRIEFQPAPDGIRIPVVDVPAGAWVRAVAADSHGRATNAVRWTGDAGSGVFHWQDGVIYYAITDRFANGSTGNDSPVAHPDLADAANYQGGDFQGILDKLREGYFRDLGVNVLWLSPLNDNPDDAWQEYLEPHRWYSGYHGYWPVSPDAVEEKFGGEMALAGLVETAHSQGFKVIADLVLKHVHKEHPWAKEHPDWFGPLELPDGSRNLRNFDSHPFTTWFEPFLPAFDFSNPTVVSALNASAVEWAKHYNFDGYRLDAVKQIPHAYWRAFRRTMRAQLEAGRSAPMYFVGETFMDRHGIASFVGPAMLDAQFEFPLYDTLIDVFARGGAGFSAVESGLAASELVFGKETPMSPLLGNHDKARFMAYADGDLPDPKQPDEEEVGWKSPPTVNHPESYLKLQLASLLLLTIDGAPMLYYGDEIGMTGAGDPDNRRPMRFGAGLAKPEQATLAFISRCIALRNAHPALRYGSRRPVLVSDDHYAFVRAYLDDRVLVAFNRSGTIARLKLPVAPELSDGTYQEMIGNKEVKVVNGMLQLTLLPRTGALITIPPGI